MKIVTQHDDALVVMGACREIPKFLAKQDPAFYQKATQPGANLEDCLKETTWCLCQCDACGDRFPRTIIVPIVVSDFCGDTVSLCYNC